MPHATRRPHEPARTTAEREADLSRAEVAVAQAEDALVDEIAEVQAGLTVAARSLQALADEAHAAQIGRPEAAELASLLLRLGATPAPTLDLDDHRERELTVREDAVRARSWVVSALQADLRRAREEIAHVEQVLSEARMEFEGLTRPEPQREPTLPAQRAPAPGAEDGGAPRREQPRVRIETEIDLHSASNFFTGFSENISEGGVFVATDRQISLGTEVDLAFRLPNGLEVRGRGVVRWLRDELVDELPSGVGVQFLNLGGPAADAIESFLRARDPIFFEGEGA